MPPEAGVHVGVAGIVLKPILNAQTGEKRFDMAMLRRAGTEGVSAHGYGQWSVPGGWLDFGETPHDAVKREIKEETSLTVTQVMTEGYVVNTHPTERLHVVCLFFRARHLSGELQLMEPDKASEVLWIPTTEVVTMPNLFAPLKSYIEQGGLLWI